MTYTCPKCHEQSTDSDYCSACGAKITGTPGGVTSLSADMTPPATSLNAGASAGISGVEICPDCGTERRNGARFCETCRYDFGSRTSYAAATPVSEPAPLAAAQAAAASVQTPAAVTAPPTPVDITPIVVTPVVTAPPIPEPRTPIPAARWEVTIQVDCSLYADPDPAVPCPTSEPERVFPLVEDENLIGRRSERKNIFPQFALNDPGISHRHAQLLREPDGGYALLDVGSTNGTELNGTPVAAGVRAPLKDGDQITLGCWTRMIIRQK